MTERIVGGNFFESGNGKPPQVSDRHNRQQAAKIDGGDDRPFSIHSEYHI